MSEGVTVRYKLGTRRAPDAPPPDPDSRPIPRAARLLALAYLVNRMVESGDFAGYADAARALGVTRARMCQVTDLLNLAAPIQERILLGELDLSERELRRVVKERGWEGQGAEHRCRRRGSVD